MQTVSLYGFEKHHPEFRDGDIKDEWKVRQYG